MAPADLWLGPGDDHLEIRVLGDAVINVGPGDDSVFMDVDPTARLSVVGGVGSDEIRLSFSGHPDGRVLLNQRYARLRIGTGPVGELWGWDVLHLWGDHDWVYRGTNSHDGLIVNAGRFTGRTYGGDDVVTLRGPGPHYVNGGAGARDHVDADRGAATCVAVELGSCVPWR
ncbi:hypothetical protein [Nocardioides antri]|uniref:Uncharacterized protein n=1 Tax=Nocardioides antri TaxID=2607659 RepID=A0A5B1M2M9_9ACTN|nr:hypothetical protein [Nocardioides antri]KAA1427162.1 hypothetical protein F0U47_06525 [Nocardioides antri]